MALNPAGADGDAVVIKDRYEIHPDQPLSELDCGAVAAYAATEIRDPSRRIYALLTEPRYPLRYDLVPVFRRIDNNSLVRVIDWDVVVWPADGRRLAALVLERPAGRRLLPAADSTIDPFREEPLMRRVIIPMTQVLTEIGLQGMAHRSIRADNLYYDGSDTADALIMLGECLCSPPAMFQPPAYETIECAMCDPAGRGDGNATNDLYALGVTLAALLMGRQPMAGLDAHEIVQRKLTFGSYSALMADHRVSLPMMEVLRGLLCDDADERWTLEDMEMWIGGRRLSPKQQIMPIKAVGPLEFGGESLNTAREAADGFAHNWDAAIQIIEDGTLDTWLRRSLSDDAMVEAVNLAKPSTENGPSGDDDATTAKVCIALDPAGPVRVREFRAMMDGIGALLAARHDVAAIRDAFVVLISENIPIFWSKRSLRPTPEIVRHASLCERARTYIDRDGMGQGVERALYEICPTAPCRSPLLENDFVVRLDQLMAALERIAAKSPGTLSTIIDPHIGAFIGSRLKMSIGGELRELQNSKDPLASALAAVRILSYTQDSGAAEVAPALCSIAVTMLEPAVERFHNRERRKDVLKRLREAAKSGQLSALLEVVDNHQDLADDETRYKDAVGEYVATMLQEQRLRYEREHRVELARELGGQISSLASGVAATIAVLIVILVKIF